MYFKIKRKYKRPAKKDKKRIALSEKEQDYKR